MTTERMNNHADLYPISTITRIDYSVFKQSAVHNLSVIQVTNSSLISDREREDGGLLDRNFGAQENEMCRKCSQVQALCTGHFGHINAATEYLIPAFEKNLFSILSLFCSQCGSSRNSAIEKYTDIEFQAQLRKLKDMTYIQRKAKLGLSSNRQKCDVCQTPFVKYKLDQGAIVVDRRKGRTSQRIVISNAELYSFASKISSRPIALLGLASHPADLFYKNYIPVPPINLRPNKAKICDDLTTALHAVYTANARIPKLVDVNDRKKESAAAQLALCAYDNSEQYGIMKNNTPFKSLSSSQRGKDNRARSNLQARRTDHSGRTVITPNTELPYGVLSIPYFFVTRAMDNVRVAVTPENIKELQDAIANQDPTYRVYWNRETREKTTLAKNRTKLGEEKRKIILKYGDHLERLIQDGDPVLYLRQPSLHRENVIAMIAKIDYNPQMYTFRFHPDTVTPFNADFDGDEMNGFLVTDKLSEVEQHLILSYEANLISCFGSQTNIGGTYSSIIGAYLFTTDEVSQEDLYMVYLSVAEYAVKPFPIDKSRAGKLTAFDVISLLLPPGLTCFRGTLRIINGNIVSTAPFTKKQIGAGQPDSLMKCLFDYNENPREAMNLSFALSEMFECYLCLRGFTVSLRDLELTPENYKTKTELKHSAFNQILTTIREFEFKSTKFLPDMPNIQDAKFIPETKAAYELIPFNFLNDDVQKASIQTSLSSIATNIGQRALEMIEEQAKNDNRMNNILSTIRSLYKTTELDVFQFISCLGQQDIGGQLIMRNLNDRTYPYFKRHTNHPIAFGYILSSLNDGLNYIEMTNLGSSGKRQIVDTTCKTAETGYRGRQVIKHLEDAIVTNLGLLAQDKLIIQTAYFNVKLEPTKIKNVHILTPNDFKDSPIMFGSITLYDHIVALYNKLKPGFIIGNRTGEINDLPFSVEPVILIHSYPNDDKPVLDLEDHIRFLDQLRLNIFFRLSYSNTLALEYILFTHFHPRLLGNRRRYLSQIFSTVLLKFDEGCPGGFAGGICTAQEMQVLTTQNAISSFHKAGFSHVQSVKVEFERYKQIIQLSKNTQRKPNDEGNAVTLICAAEHNGKARLEEIKQFVGYFALELVNPSIKIYKKRFKTLQFEIVIELNRSLLEVYSIENIQIHTMVEYWLSITDHLTSSILTSKVKGTLLVLTINCNFKSPLSYTIPTFCSDIVKEVSKGKPGLALAVVDMPGYYNIQGRKVPAYALSFTTNSLDILSKFNTVDIDVRLSSPWQAYQAFNIEACAQMIADEISNAFDAKAIILPHSNIIADKMTTQIEPYAIDRFRLEGASAMKLYAFETGQVVLSKAALQGQVDKVADNPSLIITGQPIRVGTGYNTVHVDIEFLQSIAIHKEVSETPAVDINAFLNSVY